MAVYEVMPMHEELKEFVLNGASALDLKREAIRLGMKSLRQSALEKLTEGVTTLSEVVRVSAADH
jgi:type IV pilus assembly protein PilB